ncbi:chromosome condensation protein CrcB [Humibacillus sp. DSM 29435]|uniref:fluoride efflux transporter CrcB n=1 Tax=Humibacillus sp. DSM 29435 TaxID=1869167 RepID=UPI0008724CE5|nr:fluoride efflux transporter CrcB [Humibacillus sp. DSM 29435]OFE18971.1 chromosome condensation protein CrcB [Humibacillus sp. DSM 29435]
MSPLEFAAVCVAGGLGAALRFVVDGLVRQRVRTTFPFGTAVINLSGSLVLGLLTGLTLSSVVSPAWALVAGTGLMGGYTTFSTASVETMRLLQERRYALALGNGFVVLALTVLLGLVGFWLGSGL